MVKIIETYTGMFVDVLIFLFLLKDNTLANHVSV